MKPIYTPSGAAKEYGDLAINIYTGCPHRCFYCFAPTVLHRQRETFHENVAPRANIVAEVERQLEREKITGKLVHLCFTCDPYPEGVDSSPTREIIKLLKASGNHVQILTKGSGERDLDLLDGEDWYGITLTGGGVCEEPGAAQFSRRLYALGVAHRKGVKTWISFEPVVDREKVLTLLKTTRNVADRVKIGKLNYWPSDIKWADFGREAEELCKSLGLDYAIKKSLREEMEGKKQ